MDEADTVIAVFAHHKAAEAAVKKLAVAGFDMTNLSVVGKGYQSGEPVVGFYNIGDRLKFWGQRGPFWGGLWGWFLGGLFMTVPGVGHVLVLGYLGATVISAVDRAAVAAGSGALDAALGSVGVPKDAAIRYQAAVSADDVLVMARGGAADIGRARSVLAAVDPTRLDVHAAARSPQSPALLVQAVA